MDGLNLFLLKVTIFIGEEKPILVLLSIGRIKALDTNNGIGSVIDCAKVSSERKVGQLFLGAVKNVLSKPDSETRMI